MSRWRWRVLAVYLALFAVLLWRWSGIEPSNDRDWQPETARLPYATIAGDEITLHSIRNFDYRTETDFTPAYYDKTFDLRQLDSVDLIAPYWMGPDIAHVFVSFGFAGKDYVAISIEARKERNEGYSSVEGFFRQYELFYVVADERDVIRLRTNYRRDPPEDVYLYRVRGDSESARRFFLEYVHEINRLREHPEFYNTLNHELHEQHLAAFAGQSRPPSVFLEDSGQRTCARAPLREWKTRYQPAVRGAAKAQPHQCACRGGG